MRKTLLAAMLITPLGWAQFAHAATGTITFEGTLTSATCEVSPGDGTGGSADNLLVDLKTVSFDDLTDGTGTEFGAAQRVNMVIDCDDVAGLTKVRMSFDPVSGSGQDPFDPRLLAVEGGARGVGIGLINEENHVLALHANEKIEADLVVDGAGSGTASMTMRAAYILNGDTTKTAGAATGALPFTLQYE